MLFLLLVALRLGSLVSLIKGRENGAGGESLLLLVLITVPTAFVLSKFRELVTEPRYLLPLYSAAPLLFAGMPRRRWVGRHVGPLLAAAIIVLNIWSIASVDAKLNLPDTAPGSVASNRLELTNFLLSHGLDRVYTDYWIAYPLAFESGERVIPSVTSGGFNRYLPYAYLVSVAPDPAFVFIQGSEQEKAFLARLAEVSATSRRENISIYSVYWQVSPLDRVRP